jgi:pyruvate dehydrogenase E2 component (dihydrolipoamide acetyltransferase)
MVPVVRFADLLPLNELTKALKQVAKECVEGSINPDLLAGGTITLSNLGGFGVEYFTPVLNPPQVALLGVNTISQKPVAGLEGELRLEPHLGLSLTIDHRAVDGAPGARFLQAMVAAIENINLTLSL